MARPFKGQERHYQQKNCEICSQMFISRYSVEYLEIHPKLDPRFCSRECMQRWRKVPKVRIVCLVCKEPKYINHSDLKYGRGKFCSKRCNGKYYSGPNSRLYKNGNTLEQDRIRKSEEYRNWRTSVFIRDNRTCQKCGYKGSDIEAHHLKPQSLYPELRFDLDNGQTLCKKCHMATPSYLNPHMVV